MKPVVTPEEAARLDAGSPVPVDVLMDRAGHGVARVAAEMGIGYGSEVVVLAGRGNNGGDGYVAARYLAGRGAQVTVRSLGFPKGDFSPARRAATAAVRSGVAVEPLGRPDRRWDLLIDAVFGTGFHGVLGEALHGWTELSVPVLAVDVPSGLDARTGEVRGPAFTATRTVTFHALKTGHLLGEGPDRCGRIDVVDIGLVDGRAELAVCEEEDAPWPRRPRTAHKWSVGSVLVVGGAPGMTGAATLAADGALHAGAGAVAIGCAADLQPVYATMRPGVLTATVGGGSRLGGDPAPVLARSERYRVLALGPGLGPVESGFVEAILDGWPGPVVLDADGLNALDGVSALARRRSPTVITPHAGEFRRLTGEAPSYLAARDLAASAGVVVVLKGNPTFVLGAERWVVVAGGPELATIGTGDVLTGMIAAFVAAGLPVETAARSAAYHHSMAGRRLFARQVVTAEDLAVEVGRRSGGRR